MSIKVCFTILVMVGFSLNVFAQQRPPTVSLQDIREEIEQLETPKEKLRKYVDASGRYLRNRPDSMLAIAEEIRKLEGISTKEQDAFSYFILADAWRNMNSDSAIYYAEKASGLLKDLGEHDSYISVENLRAVQHSVGRDYLQAESVMMSTIAYIESVNKEEISYPVHHIYGNLGNLYSKVGAHDLAIEMYEKFLTEEDQPNGRCNIMMRLSSNFYELEEYERAKDLLSPCLEFESLVPPIKASVRANLSRVYAALGEEDISLSILADASAISHRHNVPNIGISHLIELGNKYLAKGDIQKADSISRLLIEDTPFRVIPNIEISKNLYFADLALTRENYDEVLLHTDKAIETAENFKLTEQLSNVYELQARTYEKLGKFELAIEKHKKQNEFDKQRFDEEAQRELAMMNVRYQLQNTESELRSVSNELKNIQLRNLVIIVLLTLFGLYALYKYRVFYLLKDERTRTRIARDLHDDLSGTLSSISFFSEAAQRVQADSDESKRFLGMIDKSASEAKEKINDIIWAIDPSKDDWSVFLKKCKRYASDAFDSQEIEYELHIADDFNFPVKLEFRQNLWLIFKEVINNLAKHSKATKAIVKFEESDGKVILEVRDNGIGFDQDISHSGNGLKNLKERSHLLHGSAEVESSEGKGTQWEFEFPTK